MSKKEKNEQRRKHPWLAGAVAGGLESFLNYPFDYTKVQMQLSGGLSPRPTIGQIAKQTFDRAGVVGFYRGYGLALMFAFPSVAVRFSSFEFTKKWLDRVRCVE